MLSQTQVVAVKKALERGYVGRCNVVEYKSYQKENKTTGHKEVVALAGIPCRLSFESSSPAIQTQAAAINQSIKVFCAPDVSIKPGSKLIITQSGRTVVYQSSGEPALYATHQEIALELWKGWA